MKTNEENQDCRNCLCSTCEEKGQYEDCSCPCAGFPNSLSMVVECYLRKTGPFCKTELFRKTTADYCRQYGISNLYHLTAIENIQSIFQHGLLSHNGVKRKRLAPVSYSHENIQERRGRDISVGNRPANDYVPLFFSEKAPTLEAMEMKQNSRGKAIVYICIKGEIIGEEGVYFSDRNVAIVSTPVNKYNHCKDLNKLDWKTIRAPYENYDAYAIQVKNAEVLVPSRVDPSWFQKLVVPDGQAASYLKALIRKLNFSIPVEVNESFYYTQRGHRHY
jgi:hypothetical protein